MNSEDSSTNMHDNPEPEKADNPEIVEDVVEDIGEEYANLDEALDQIGSYLDQLEEKNDDIYARLQDLLESSRQTRQELEAERLAAGESSKNESNSKDKPPDESVQH